jgi:neutral trehalase
LIYLSLSWNILLYCIQQLSPIEIGQFKFHVYFWHLVNVVENYIIGTYFIMLGLVRSNKTELVNHRLDHYAYLIRTIGHNSNENWYYFVSRSQLPLLFINERIMKTKFRKIRDWISVLNKEKVNYTWWSTYS